MSSSFARASLSLSFSVVLVGAALVACGDDTSTGGAGGAADTTSSTGGTKTTSSTKTTSTGSTTGSNASSTSDASSTATGTASSASTTASSSVSASSSSTGAGVCMNIPVNDTSNAVCDAAEPLMPRTDNVACTPGDFSVWPVIVYAIDVGEQDCLFMNATNVNGTVDVADLFAAVIDPNGDNQYFDDDIDCAGDVDGLCPAGGLTMPTAGTAYVLVGAYESDGCPAGGTTDFRVAASLNGTDVDLSNAAVCLGDLNILIP